MQEIKTHAGYSIDDPVNVEAGNWKGHKGKVTALAPDASKCIGVKVESLEDKHGHHLVWYEPTQITKAV